MRVPFNFVNKGECMQKESGFINIYKNSGCTSAAVVHQVKKLIGLPCGHMGTLDPLAEGVLPIAFGKATRLFNYLQNKQKTYRAIFEFGKATDTEDCTGTVLQEQAKVPTLEEIQQVLPRFTGEYMQVPPMYSAKSVNGVRAYKLARQGEKVELQAKKITIYKLICTRQLTDNQFEFLITCGGGTYIRSLGRDIAAACGTVAIMTALIREKSGYFSLQNAVKLEEIQADKIDKFLLAPESVFEMQSVNFDDADAVKLRNGLTLPFYDVGEYKLYLNDYFYGIAEADGKYIKAKVRLV